ncbi:ABC transporter substrate-binding protein [Allobacillus sp. GCM10007491]|uniref:ABC transporter substrate-binding protein n=1 Tax=Allobacillus saliphilus TaxID=2912308 RepID=A0A941CXH5_9BACI|nr:ABC transporter substrate-binding protein [Allobacillus saliphilus]MBR7554969.1 ABC transporter substrate-binding protein [Allobacillus saliphilus]
MKKLQGWLVLLIGLLVLSACGASDDESSAEEVNKDDADFVVGISQIEEHPALDSATEGFKQALKDAGLEVHFDFSSAQGDANTNQLIAEKFVSNDVDLIFANSTPSAQGALNETEEIPIVFTSVTDPVGANLIESFENPGGNVTGTADMHPDTVKKTVELVKEMGYESLGLVYNASEQNSKTQIELVNEEAKAAGVNTVEKTISSSSEVKQATEALVGDVDSILIITDNTVVSALESVLQVSHAESIPVFVSEHSSVESGGLAAFGFNYFDIGYEAGEKAVEILKDGKNPGEIPSTYPQNLKLQINEDAAEKMGVELTDELKEKAELISGE